MPIIDVKKLEKAYQDGDVETKALRGVTFQIREGEFVAIMGPSGSGKSTLLHILGFLESPTGGSYLFDGRPFDSYSGDEVARVRNKKMGFIFQSFNLLARTTVYDNVRLPLLYSGTAEAGWDTLVRNAIESVGLTHRIRHESSQLSGGEKQRVAIARALVTNPSVIFADEPTGNLDSQSGKQVMEIIQRLNEKEGRTVILITHETYTAEHAERILRVRDGLLESDTQVTKRRGRGDEFLK